MVVFSRWGFGKGWYQWWHWVCRLVAVVATEGVLWWWVSGRGSVLQPVWLQVGVSLEWLGLLGCAFGSCGGLRCLHWWHWQCPWLVIIVGVSIIFNECADVYCECIDVNMQMGQENVGGCSAVMLAGFAVSWLMVVSQFGCFSSVVWSLKFCFLPWGNRGLPRVHLDWCTVWRGWQSGMHSVGHMMQGVMCFMVGPIVRGSWSFGFQPLGLLHCISYSVETFPTLPVLTCYSWCYFHNCSSIWWPIWLPKSFNPISLSPCNTLS